jgi:hypothetical protein
MGTLVRIKLDGRQTNGRFGMFELTLPHGAAPPLHSHPQDETLYVIEGDVVAWIVEPELAASSVAPPPARLSTCARRCGPGATRWTSHLAQPAGGSGQRAWRRHAWPGPGRGVRGRGDCRDLPEVRIMCASRLPRAPFDIDSIDRNNPHPGSVSLAQSGRAAGGVKTV